MYRIDFALFCKKLEDNHLHLLFKKLRITYDIILRYLVKCMYCLINQNMFLVLSTLSTPFTKIHINVFNLEI